MWSEHTLVELSTETLCNCNYFYKEIEDVTTENLRKSKVQHRGQVCYCTAKFQLYQIIYERGHAAKGAANIL